MHYIHLNCNNCKHHETMDLLGHLGTCVYNAGLLCLTVGLRGEVPLEGTYCRGLTDVWRESPQYRNMATKPSDSAGLTFSAVEDNPTKRVGMCVYMRVLQS